MLRVHLNGSNHSKRLGFIMCAAALLCTPSIGTAPKRPISNQSGTLAAIAKLGGAMPQSFDVYPGDPCGGPWHGQTASGTPVELTVMRYQGVGLVHVVFPQNEDNIRIIRLSSQSISFTVGSADFIMRCVMPKAALTSMAVIDGEPRSIPFDHIRTITGASALVDGQGA